MKKRIMVLGYLTLVTTSSFINADDHRYYSDNDDMRHESHSQQWQEYHSDNGDFQKYQNDTHKNFDHNAPSRLYTPSPNNYGQPPIQIYVFPNQKPSKIEQQYQEDRYWQERRAYIEGMTAPPRLTRPENQFFREDSHW